MAWVTVTELAESKGLPFAEAEDQAWAVRSCDAVNAFVARRRPDLPADGLTPNDPAYADVRLGAVLLAQAVYERRGVAGENDMWTYPARVLDANVSELLGLNRPVVA